MDVTFKETRVHFHAIDGAVGRVQGYEKSARPFVAVELTDDRGNLLTVYLGADQARTLVDLLADAVPPVGYEPTDEGEADAPEVII
jgi:hypothetical protein